MSRFWKPGSAKPRLVDDEDGGVLFYSTTQSSSSSKYGFVNLEQERQRLPVVRFKAVVTDTCERIFDTKKMKMSFESVTEGMFWNYSCEDFVLGLYIDNEKYVEISTHDLVYVENDM